MGDDLSLKIIDCLSDSEFQEFLKRDHHPQLLRTYINTNELVENHMKIDQLSIFLENQSGRLANVVSTLGDNQINIHAMSLTESTRFGILRLIVDSTVQMGCPPAISI